MNYITPAGSLLHKMKSKHESVDEMAARIEEKYKLDEIDTTKSIGYNDDSMTYYGWSHRAICGFTIGDKIFDPKWVPDKYSHIDFDKWSHRVFEKDEKRPKEYNDFLKARDYIDDLPFTKRGAVTIKDKDDAKQAALAFAEYVS